MLRWRKAAALCALAASALTPFGVRAEAGTAPRYQGLTRAEVLSVLGSAIEKSAQGPTGEHLAVAGRIVTVPDGFGGSLTAVPTVRFPTADGYGQYVLFWHDKTFLGSDRLAKLPYLGAESVQIEIVAHGPRYITLQFERYRPSDPMYAPSLPQADITYRWTGTALAASSAVPISSGNGLAMTLQP